MIISFDSDPIHLSSLIKDDIKSWQPVSENAEAVDYILRYAFELEKNGHKSDLRSFKTFLPPRLISAAKNGRLVVFFGSGISVGAGVPTWGSLLEKLGVTQDFANEPYLENDPLTMAELIAHEIGNEQLQRELRLVMKKARTPTLVHYLLARLSQPVYITTNYDFLFELAWETVHPKEKPIVVTNDADLVKNGIDPNSLSHKDGLPVLLKVHGCADRDSEEMILTRSQYRRHYRSNTKLFEAVCKSLESKHTFFLGFGHRDPEISRLVEDVIYRFESHRHTGQQNPAIYSLQFDMKEKTPEVFAARGIVALQPPFSIDTPNKFDHRAASTTKAIVDLIGAMDSNVHEKLDLDSELNNCVSILSSTLYVAMRKLESVAARVLPVLNDIPVLRKELDDLRDDLGELAGQGVYLLSDNGDIRCCSLPKGLVAPQRYAKASLHERFYVRQAKTFRRPFVSDSDKSVFNGQSTIFLCQPLGGITKYMGLLFAAAQIGVWKLPLNLKQNLLQKNREASFVLARLYRVGERKSTQTRTAYGCAHSLHV